MISYLQAKNISKSFGNLLLFENLSFSIHKNQKLALIAKNGAGKTSLLKIIAGNDIPDTGEITLKNNISVGFLEQLPFVDNTKTVLEEVFYSSNKIVQTIKKYNDAINSGDKKMLETAMTLMDNLNAWDYEVKAKQVLSELKITDYNKKIKELSGGQKKRVALANVLINEPDILIMDEPTNHLDMDMIEWLEEYLLRMKSSLLMVTHDRYFLDNVCSDIMELDDKKLYHYKGNYSYFLEKRQDRIYNFNAEVDKARNILRKELVWMKNSPKARTSKSKSRINAFYDLEEKASRKKYEQKIKIDILSARLGKKILNINYLNKSFGDNIVIKDFSYSFVPCEKIGIIGKNGTGKTTLLNIITQNIKPDSGKLELGETVVFGYYKQEMAKFKPDKKVIDIITDIAEQISFGNGKKFSASQFLQYFLFTPEMQYTKVEKLSGGEKRRLYLMTVLMQNPNFLILDEPTNDLDILTLNVLEEYLVNFQGCLIIVSHDRFFMDKIVDNIFAFEGNGKIKIFPGNYSEYREKNKKHTNPSKKNKTKQIVRTKKEQKKLSYKDKYEMEQIEKDLKILEQQKELIEEEINTGNLTANELNEKSKQFGDILKTIEEKELRWLELSDKI